ncbi:uncharacterized protein LOC128176242 [Crassostrea angulata]|uniref:uncharacterized protein LOC128176242 n=1 Tax=Magallana angulata TaxID=2784310 RepID=UPI0022B1387D|nr:uncharacterized protein LOC128176242 [Crassostrea angulata]
MFEVRKTPCAYDKASYEEDKALFNCQSSTNVYHCVKNDRKRIGEICIQPIWVQPNFCPEYNTGSYNLDVVPCNVSSGSCPEEQFQSNEVYKYPVCINTTFIPYREMTGDEQVSKDNVLPLPWILVGVVLLLFICLFIACCVVWCRNRRNFKRKLTQTIQTLISQREDNGVVSRNQQPVEKSPPAINLESLAGPSTDSEQKIETIINPHEPDSYEGTSFDCINVRSNNADLDLEVNNAIISVNDELGMHVAHATKQKIMKGEFVELYTSNEPFYRSAAFREGVNFIENGGKLLCLVGQWGSGKTSTAKEVYVSVTNTHPVIIPNSSTLDVGNQPVIFDEAILKEITNVEKNQLREKIKILFKKMSLYWTNPFIIITLDGNIKHLYDFVKSLSPCKEDVKFIDLSKTLTKGDRTQILTSQLEFFSPNEDFSKVEKLDLKGTGHSLGYPEACALFSRCSAFQKICPVVFCNRPLRYLKKQLEDMHYSEDSEKFLMLVYMSLNQMEIDVDTTNDMLNEILKSCQCGIHKNDNSKTTQMKSLGTKLRNIGDELNDSIFKSTLEEKDRHKDYMTSLLSNEFVVKDADTSNYRLQHAVVKRMALIVFGTYHFDKLLEFSKPEDLKGWVKEKKINCNLCEHFRDMKPVLEIKQDQWWQFQEKLGKASS